MTTCQWGLGRLLKLYSVQHEPPCFQLPRFKFNKTFSQTNKRLVCCSKQAAACRAAAAAVDNCGCLDLGGLFVSVCWLAKSRWEMSPCPWRIPLP